MLARHLTLECLMENIDIAKHIFGFLAYEDQLNLSRVCKQFKDIIIHFLWKQIYSRVRIVKKSKCNLISTLSHQLEHSSSPPMWQSSSTEYTTTKLSNLVITVNLFEVSLNLWLGLLSKNPLLVLTVCFDIFNKNAMHRLLHNLINNEKFPTRIKSIQICGLHIDCKEMKFFLEATLKKLEIITSMVEPAKKHLTMVF
ncbi:uncharacterized protein isoform X2 [Musca autumnalis]|uniref:uncharacterized protein isoform X2 n=1 Tax=Musca autumnalis TaxID=221902 RepID=UPI003CF74442